MRLTQSLYELFATSNQILINDTLLSMVLGYKRTCWRYYVNSEGLRGDKKKHDWSRYCDSPLKRNCARNGITIKEDSFGDTTGWAQDYEFSQAEGVVLKPSYI